MSDINQTLNAVKASHPQLSSIIEEIRGIYDELQMLINVAGKTCAADNPFISKYPPGHFYSPIPDMAAIHKQEKRLFNSTGNNVPGVDLRANAQLKFLDSLLPYYSSQPYAEHKLNGFRYYFDNSYFRHADATILHCLLRYLKPRKVIEIGSGFSSCIMLDTNEHFLNGSMNLKFIDPNPQRLLENIRPEDKKTASIIPCALQDADMSLVSDLECGDILFIDSSHVLKIESELNIILFEILPTLKSGVYIHFHDIFYPFQYPRQWIKERRAWNEAYALQAFLQYNSAFEIVLFNNYLKMKHAEFLCNKIPHLIKSVGGSLWLRKCIDN